MSNRYDDDMRCPFDAILSLECEHIFDTLILPEIGDMYIDEVKQMRIKELTSSLNNNSYQ